MARAAVRLAGTLAAAALAAVLGAAGCGDNDQAPVGGTGGQGGDVVPDAGGGTGGGSGDDNSALIFDETRLHDVDLMMAPSDWQSIIDDSRGDEWRSVTVVFDGETVENVGVRPSGESSRVPGNPKMSVRLKFNAFGQDRKFHGIEEVKLDGAWDDASLLRERLSYFLCRSFMAAPREVHTRLLINGAMWGVYDIEEVWDERAVKAHFSQPLGQLYRIRSAGLNLDPYAYMGESPATYVPVPWEPKGKDALAADHAPIPVFLRTLAQSLATADQLCDTEALVSYFACGALVTNTDGFTGELEVDDHFQYSDPSTGKFVILPWDLDNTFGSLNDPPARSIFKNFDKSVLSRYVQDTPELRRRMQERIAQVISTQMPLATLHAQADFIYQQIQAAAYEDTHKIWPNSHFDWSLGFVKDFAAQRYASLQEQTQ